MFRGELPGAAPDYALDAYSQLLFRDIAMAGQVLRRVVNGVVHQVDSGIVVIEVRPSAQ